MWVLFTKKPHKLFRKFLSPAIGQSLTLSSNHQGQQSKDGRFGEDLGNIAARPFWSIFIGDLRIALLRLKGSKLCSPENYKPIGKGWKIQTCFVSKFTTTWIATFHHHTLSITPAASTASSLGKKLVATSWSESLVQRPFRIKTQRGVVPNPGCCTSWMVFQPCYNRCSKVKKCTFRPPAQYLFCLPWPPKKGPGRPRKKVVKKKTAERPNFENSLCFLVSFNLPHVQTAEAF